MWRRLIYWLLGISLGLLAGCANNSPQPNLTTNYGRGTAGTGQRIGSTTMPTAPRPSFDPIKLYKGSYAMLVGASEYRAGWPRLPGVKKDIPAVKAALERHGFQVTVVLDPTRNQLLQAYDNFINKYGLAEDNRLLFYFAGHGYTNKMSYGEEMGYIVPVDAPNPYRDLTGFMQFGIDMQRIEGYAKRINSKHAIFLFDSCFSGSLFALSRAVPASITYKTTRPVRQFITSGSAEEEVPDRSVFREQFVAALDGEADVNKDGYVTGSELGIFLQDTVINYSKSTQHPQYGKIRNRNLDKGDFVFQIAAAPPPDIPTPVAVPASGTQVSANTAQDSKVAELEAKLAEAKRQAALAKAREQQARSEKAEAARKLATQREQAAHQARLQAEQARLAKIKQQREYEEARLAELERQRHKAAEESKRLAALRKQRQAEEARLARLRQKQRHKSYEPEMVSIPAGKFKMGGVQYSDDEFEEKPVHEVYVKAFSISKYEITVGQFKSFVRDTNYRGSKVDRDWGCKGFMQPTFTQADNHPVVCVTWHDAVAYTKWLSRKTGKKYRLPTEAEWEYVARAGTSTWYWWGDNLGRNKANCPGCGSRWDMDMNSTAPVGSFAANPWGLYDTAGNVWEWTCSQATSSYDGSEKKCLLSDPSARIVRGGSWNHGDASSVRSADRNGDEPNYRNSDVGLRLALGLK